MPKKLIQMVKVLEVPKLTPQAVTEGKPVWKTNVEDTKDVLELKLDDLGYGSCHYFQCTHRFGNMPFRLP